MILSPNSTSQCSASLLTPPFGSSSRMVWDDKLHDYLNVGSHRFVGSPPRESRGYVMVAKAPRGKHPDWTFSVQLSSRRRPDSSETEISLFLSDVSRDNEGASRRLHTIATVGLLVIELVRLVVS